MVNLLDLITRDAQAYLAAFLLIFREGPADSAGSAVVSVAAFVGLDFLGTFAFFKGSPFLPLDGF